MEQNNNKKNKNKHFRYGRTANYEQSSDQTEETKQFADKLRADFNSLASTGGRSHFTSSYNRVSSNGGTRCTTSCSPQIAVLSFTGKTQEEIDQITREMAQKMYNDITSGRLVQSQIYTPQYFENRASEKLRSLQRQSQSQYSQSTGGFSHGQTQSQHQYYGGAEDSENLQQSQQSIFDAEDVQQVQQNIFDKPAQGNYYHQSHDKESQSGFTQQTRPVVRHDTRRTSETNQEELSVDQQPHIPVIHDSYFNSDKETLDQVRPQYQPTHGQTVHTSNTVVQERENHRPIRPATSVHTTEYNETERSTDRQTPRPYVSTGTASHSIYNHLRESDRSVPNYKPRVIVTDQSQFKEMEKTTNNYRPVQREPITFSVTDSSDRTFTVYDQTNPMNENQQIIKVLITQKAGVNRRITTEERNSLIEKIIQQLEIKRPNMTFDDRRIWIEIITREVNNKINQINSQITTTTHTQDTHVMSMRPRPQHTVQQTTVINAVEKEKIWTMLIRELQDIGTHITENERKSLYTKIQQELEKHQQFRTTEEREFWIIILRREIDERIQQIVESQQEEFHEQVDDRRVVLTEEEHRYIWTILTTELEGRTKQITDQERQTIVEKVERELEQTRSHKTEAEKQLWLEIVQREIEEKIVQIIEDHRERFSKIKLGETEKHIVITMIEQELEVRNNILNDNQRQTLVLKIQQELEKRNAHLNREDRNFWLIIVQQYVDESIEHLVKENNAKLSRIQIGEEERRVIISMIQHELEIRKNILTENHKQTLIFNIQQELQKRNQHLTKQERNVWLILIEREVSEQIVHILQMHEDRLRKVALTESERSVIVIMITEELEVKHNRISENERQILIRKIQRELEKRRKDLTTEERRLWLEICQIEVEQKIISILEQNEELQRKSALTDVERTLIITLINQEWEERSHKMTQAQQKTLRVTIQMELEKKQQELQVHERRNEEERRLWLEIVQRDVEMRLLELIEREQLKQNVKMTEEETKIMIIMLTNGCQEHHYELDDEQKRLLFLKIQVELERRRHRMSEEERKLWLIILQEAMESKLYTLLLEWRSKNGFDNEEDLGQQQHLVTIDESKKPPQKIISADRGDQPPQHFENDYESEENLEQEPGIGAYPIDKNSPTTRRPIEQPRRPIQSYAQVVSEAPRQHTYPAPQQTEYERRYHKKVTTITTTGDLVNCNKPTIICYLRKN